MENKKIDTEKIKFEYSDNLLPDTNREHTMVNNINLMLSEFSDKINEQEGIINVYFKNDKEQRMHFDNMGNDLQTILYRKLETFQFPDNHGR